jgi:hypothetical protein
MFCDGTLAPVHVQDGLPDGLIVQRDSQGHVTEVKKSVVSGFIRQQHFYTRDQVAQIQASQVLI